MPRRWGRCPRRIPLTRRRPSLHPKPGTRLVRPVSPLCRTAGKTSNPRNGNRRPLQGPRGRRAPEGNAHAWSGFAHIPASLGIPTCQRQVDSRRRNLLLRRPLHRRDIFPDDMRTRCESGSCRPRSPSLSTTPSRMARSIRLALMPQTVARSGRSAAHFRLSRCGRQRMRGH